MKPGYKANEKEAFCLASSNFKPNILDAIRMISAAWEEVKPETIKKLLPKGRLEEDGQRFIAE